MFNLYGIVLYLRFTILLIYNYYVICYVNSFNNSVGVEYQ